MMMLVIGFTSVGIKAITTLAEFLQSSREKSILRSKGVVIGKEL